MRKDQLSPGGIGQYRAHPAAAVFPLMEGEEFDALVQDIREKGLLVPIWLDPDGSIIDGRNRYRACLQTGVEPRFETWRGEGSLLQFIVSLNLKRRHLTPSQRAALAIEILPALEAEARTRQRTSTGGRKPQLMEKVPQAAGTARAQAAKLVGVNERYVAQAKEIQAANPELLKQVSSGDKTLVDARRLCAKAKHEKEAKEQQEACLAQWPIARGDGGWTAWGAEASATGPYSHVLPLERLWLSPRDKLAGMALDYPDSLERRFVEFRARVSRFDFGDSSQFPDRVIEGARKLDRVFDRCLEILLSAADKFTDECVAALREASDAKIPAGKPEQHEWLLQANRRQKNSEGWCAELGCWAVIDVEAAKQGPLKPGEVYCPKHLAAMRQECGEPVTPGAAG